MARTKLSKRLIDGLKPKPTEYTVWDEEVRGLGLRVLPSGTKTFVLRMMTDGRQRWYGVGIFGRPWTVETAQAEANRVLGQAAQVNALRETGTASTAPHPIEARERQRTIPSVAAFARRYLEEHAIPHKGAATVQADRSLLGLRLDADGQEIPAAPGTILDKLGATRVDRVTRGDIVAYHLSLKDTPTRANRALALLSHMFTMAEKWGLRADYTNPCRHVERFEENRRERYLSAAEMARLGAALAAVEKEGRLTPYGLAAIRLLAFTGARASEVLGLKWSDVSGESVRLVRKGRVGTLHLPPAARTVLKALPRLKGNPHVIVGGREAQPLTLWGLEAVWQTVREKAGLEDVRLHDLRHGFASVAAAGGSSLPIIGALLGHTVPTTTARYAHLAADPLAAVAKTTAATIAKAMKPKPKRKQGNVTAMAGRRR